MKDFLVCVVRGVAYVGCSKALDIHNTGVAGAPPSATVANTSLLHAWRLKIKGAV